MDTTRKLRTTVSEDEARAQLTERMLSSGIPQEQLLENLGLFIPGKDLSRTLFMDFLFRQIREVQGVVMDFGTRWGQNAALFTTLRGIYDPFNRHRKVIAFDTFEGFPSAEGNYEEGQRATTPGWEDNLNYILRTQEQLAPLAHIQKFEVVKGDVYETVPQYMKDHPETIVALAYFDMDLYKPTKRVLWEVARHVTRGAVFAFDELNDPDSPGETEAVREVLGLNHYRIKRYPWCSRVSYMVVE